MVSKLVLSFVFILTVVALGMFVPNYSFAASPFLVKHSSVEQMNQSGQGRAIFASDEDDSPKQSRKPITLAESLVHLRQCHLADEQHARAQSTTRQGQQETHTTQVIENTSISALKAELKTQPHNVNHRTQSKERDNIQSSSANQSHKIFLARPQS